MEMNQFSFGRFGRLLRAKFKESWRPVLQYSLTLSAIFLVIRIGYVVFSSDSLANAFTKGADNIYDVSAVLLFIAYFFSIGILIGFVGNFLTLPITNLERFALMHMLPLINFFLVTAMVFISNEIMWRLGLWLIFPNVFDQYVEAMAGFSFKLISGRVLLKTLIFLPVVYYVLFLMFSDHLDKYNKKIHRALFGWILPLGTIFLIVFIAILMDSFGIPYVWHFFLGMSLLLSIFLLIFSYRGFCRFEPSLQKTSKE